MLGLLPTNGGPRYPKFASTSSRLSSFGEAVANRYAPYGKFANSGFFYTSVGNRVTCFYCGTVLHDWYYYDNPWTEHFLSNSRCAYLKLNHNRVDDPEFEYWLPTEVSSIEEKYSALLKEFTAHQFQTLCKICWNHKASYAYVPCGHIICCSQCVTSQSHCPVCRKNVEHILKIFL
jgi:hypothetical protein